MFKSTVHRWSLVAAAVSLVFAGNASALLDEVHWDGEAGNGKWTSGSNWNPDAVPSSDEQAEVDNLGVDVTIDYDTPYYGEPGKPAYLGTLVMNSATAGTTNTLNISAPLILNPVAGGYGNGAYNAFQTLARCVVNVEPGGVLSLQGVHDAPLTGTGPGFSVWNVDNQFNINGGSVTSVWRRGLGSNNRGTFTINSGTLYQWQSLGNYLGFRVVAESTFVMHGGTATVDRFSMGLAQQPNSNLVSTALIDGGTLNVTPQHVHIGGNGGGQSAGSQSPGDMTVSGGKVNCRFMQLGQGLGWGRLTVSGGVFNQVGTSIDGHRADIGFDDDRPDLSAPHGMLTITGTGLYNSRCNMYIGRNVDINSVRRLGDGALVMNGGELNITNTATLKAEFGTLYLSNGVINADNVDIPITTTDMGGGDIVTTTGHVVFVGGTLNTGGTTVDNGEALVVGGSASNAVLRLVGGTHSFADGLTIAANGTLTGEGDITGDVAIGAGGGFRVAVGAGDTPEVVAVDGDLDLSAAGNTLSVERTLAQSGVAITYTGALTGTFGGTSRYRVDYGTGNNSQITIYPPPTGTFLAIY